jgi:hypothetical protein
VKINKWLGWVPSFSRYLLPVGGAVELVNLTTLVPGQLSVRGGSKQTTKTSTRMVELWGLSTGSSQTDIILGQGDNGNIVEVKDGVESLKNAGQFTGDHPVTFSQGRRGEVYIYQGYGKRGLVRDVTGTVRPVGLDAPTAKPEIAIDSSASYYVARIDLTDVGNGYHLAPAVSIAAPPAGGRQAKALSRISDATVSAIEVTDGGAGYTKVPCVTLTDTPNGPATGVGASAVIELEAGAARGDSETGIVYWEVSQLPTWWWLCLSEYPREGSGYIVPATGGSGTGAKAIFWFDGLYEGNCYKQNSDGTDLGTFGVRVQVYDFGQGYQPGDIVTATLHTANAYQSGPTTFGPRCDTTAECQVRAEGIGLYSPKAPDRLTILNANTYKQRKVKTTVTNGGSGYLTPPIFQTEDGDLIRTEVNCDGAVTKLILDQPNKVYLFPPKLVNTAGDVGGARALAIVRPNFRGKYQCYVRYANESVTKEQGGPLYSNLSPVNEVDAGECAKRLTWALPATAPTSATHIELWRSTSNQAITLFKVAKLPIGTTTYEDLIHDKDLTDATRTDYEAQSILLSDGRLNLNAYGVPSGDFAVGQIFQDRLFMGVSTTDKRVNTLLYSEADKPESVPEINELVLQTNIRDSDFVTALAPFAGALMVFQSRHTYRLNFVSRPEIDATVSLVAYRGCINQRCWDVWMGDMYAVDDNGLYKIDQQGSVEDFSDAVASLFRTNTDPLLQTLDFSKKEFWFVRVDKNVGVVRFHVSFTGDQGKYPSRMLVYDPDSKAFWLESYPHIFSASAQVRDADGSLRPYLASESGLHIVAEGLTDDGKPVPYAFRTGNMAFITDETDKNGGQQNSRGISVLYKPTMTESLLKLQWFANASETPRGNVARRDVGVGFTMDDTDPSSFVNMQSERHEGAPANGIARARFAGKTMTFVDGADTHVSLRLFGEQSDAGPVVIHELTVNGVQDNGK